MYEEKLTVEQHKIQYEYKPFQQNETKRQVKWSYKTHDRQFGSNYQRLLETISDIMGRDTDACHGDRYIQLKIKYEDKSKKKRMFIYSDDLFKDCYDVLRQMVPGEQGVPRFMKE